ncbi:ABC transporter transmembrane domain-containing protein [Latilactobacillus curvatus]|uniref:ABC transporter transmembrane domain-containing protein n=1 Tax=Latilactobacillus curvatus TaxID=28038 RepID=UPI0022448448|nr:ABC transporter transmembrane domain-containing protein [Latilactobacillus curvatus]MCW8780666.1 ABC transporter transmembrane domain-containing protein [Latilactobacillus curvatus]
MHIQNLFGRKKLILIIFFLTILAVSVNAIYPYITKIVIDNVLIGKNVLLMRNIILGLGLIIIIQVLVDFFLSYLSSVWVQKNISDIRNLIFDRFLKIDPFSTNKNGQTLIISDAEVIAANVQSILLTSLNSGLSIIVFGVIAFTISPLLTLVILSALPIFVLANIKLSSISKDKFFETQHSKDELLSKLTDFLSGKIFIKIYHAELYAKSELVNLNKQLKNNSISLSTVMIMVKDVLAILTSVTPFIVLSIGMGLSLNHQISTGGLIAIYTYAGMIFSPVSNLVNLMPAYQQIIVALERINNYLVLEPEGAAITTKLHDNSNKKVTLVNNINLVKNDVPILKNMTLNMDNEHIYMLTGPNGSGKSMLGKILTGLIFPSSGNIW